MRGLVLPALAAAVLQVQPAGAATLLVGPGRPLATPSAAAAIVREGDIVLIDPGTYYDCAVWRASRLTIAASAPGVLLTDTPCEGKAAFVIRGDDVTIRGLAFARIRVPDRNGAGIRAEGGALTVVASRFTDNQVGVLAATGTLRLIDCEFTGNGVAASPPEPARGHDIQAGRLDLLRVAGSRFGPGHGMAAIDSAARRTELVGNRLSGRTPLVSLTDGGDALVEGNVFDLADPSPNAGATQAALLIAENGDQPAGRRLLRGNTLLHRGAPAALLRDWSAVPALLEANILPVGDRPVVRDGAWLNRAKTTAHHLLAWLHGLLGGLRHAVAVLIGRAAGTAA